MPLLTYTFTDAAGRKHTADLWCKLHAPETVRRALEAYRKGGQPSAVAKRAGVSVSTLEKWVAKVGIGRSRRDAARVKVAHDKGMRPADFTALGAEAERLYLEEGLSTVTVAERLGVSPSVVWKWLKRRGVVRKKVTASGARPAFLAPETRAELTARAVRLYTERHLSGPEVARVLGVSYYTLAAWLRKAGVVRSRVDALNLRRESPHTPEGKRRRERAREVWRLKAQGHTRAAIARALSISPHTVSAYLKSE